MAVQSQKQETYMQTEAPLALDTRLRMEQKAEAAEVLAKIAKYPPEDQKAALLIMHGIRIGESLATHNNQPRV